MTNLKRLYVYVYVCVCVCMHVHVCVHVCACMCGCCHVLQSLYSIGVFCHVILLQNSLSVLVVWYFLICSWIWLHALQLPIYSTVWQAYHIAINIHHTWYYYTCSCSNSFRLHDIKINILQPGSTIFYNKPLITHYNNSKVMLSRLASSYVMQGCSGFWILILHDIAYY